MTSPTRRRTSVLGSVTRTRVLGPRSLSADLELRGVDGHGVGGGGALAGSAAALVDDGGESEHDDQADGPEDDRSEDRGDAGGGEEPEDGTGAAGSARSGTGAEDTEAGSGVGGFHGGQRWSAGGAEEADQDGLAVGWGVDLEGKAPGVDGQGEVEELAAALLGVRESGDLGDINTWGELEP